MTDTELYLSGYSSHLRSIRRLENELRAAQASYNAAYEPSAPCMALVKVNARKVSRPTESAAIALVDSLGAEVKRIERLLLTERLSLSAIENLVNASGLYGDEMEYVRLKYFEGRSNEYMCNQILCSASSLLRIRQRALEKIERVKRT